MSGFKVKISGIEQSASEEQKIEEALNSLGAEIRSVRSALSGSVGNYDNLRSTLGVLANRVEQHEQDVKKLRSSLISVKNNYEKTERRICGYINDHPITMDDIWNAVTTVGKGLVVSALINPGAGLGWLIGTILKDEEWTEKNEFLKGDFTLGEISDKKKTTLADDHYEYDKKKGEWVKKKKEDDKKKTKEEEAKLKRKEILESITLWSDSLSKEGSLLHFGKDGDVETEWGNYTYSADILKAELTASGYAGPGGCGGEIGVALTAFTAKTGFLYGSEDMGVHASGKIDVGRAAASLGGDVGLWDENGDFNPQIGVTGKLEAIAAEVSGEAGVNIAGTEINAKGSLNFGIGAHADVGLRDGKFRLDLGASVGVGGSISLEVDLSGTIDKVVEHAQEIGNAVSEAYEAASDFVSSAADTIGDMGRNIGRGFKSGIDTVAGWFKW